MVLGLLLPGLGDVAEFRTEVQWVNRCWMEGGCRDSSAAEPDDFHLHSNSNRPTGRL